MASLQLPTIDERREFCSGCSNLSKDGTCDVDTNPNGAPENIDWKDLRRELSLDEYGVSVLQMVVQDSLGGCFDSYRARMEGATMQQVNAVVDKCDKRENVSQLKLADYRTIT